MGQGRWFDSQLRQATTVLSIIFPKSTFWDTGTTHQVHPVSPHKPLLFPCSRFWICRGQILLPGARLWTWTGFEATSVLCSSLPHCGQEVTRGNSVGFQWKYPRVTWVQVQWRRECPNLHEYTYNWHSAAMLQSLCQDTVWLLDLFVPSLSGFKMSSSQPVGFHTPFVALCTTTWPLIAPVN